MEVMSHRLILSPLGVDTFHTDSTGWTGFMARAQRELTSSSSGPQSSVLLQVLPGPGSAAAADLFAVQLDSSTQNSSLTTLNPKPLHLRHGFHVDWPRTGRAACNGTVGDVWGCNIGGQSIHRCAAYFRPVQARRSHPGAAGSLACGLGR